MQPSAMTELPDPSAQGESLSLSARIRKYIFHYFLPIPALLVLFGIHLPPLAAGFVIPFKTDIRHMDFIASPWGGLDHFRRLFRDPLFGHALANTIVIKLSAALLCGFAALGLGLALHSLRSRRLKGGLAVLFLVPFFIPSAVLLYGVLDLLPAGFVLQPDGFPLGVGARARLLAIALLVLKTCGIPAALAMLAAGTCAGRAAVPAALRAVAAFVLVQLSGLFSADFDLIRALGHPLVLESVVTLDDYIFRTGFQMIDIGLAGAAWMVQFVLQFPLLLAAYFLIRRFLSPGLFGAGREEAAGQGAAPETARGRRIAGAAAVSTYALCIVLLLYRLYVRPFLLPSDAAASGDRMAGTAFCAGVVLVSLAVIFHVLFTAMLAYPLTVRTLPGRGFYKALLLLFAAAGPMMLQQFVYFRSLMMWNTVLPYVLLGLFNPASVFVLKEWFNRRFGERKHMAERSGQGEARTMAVLFLPNVWRPLVGLAVLQAAAMWNSFQIPLVYFSAPALHTPVLAFASLALGFGTGDAPFGDPMVLQAGALAGLPPVLLFLLFSRWVTAELFVSQIRRH